MERIATSLRDKIKSVERATALIQSGSMIGYFGFALVGEPKAAPHKLVRQEKAGHLTILTGVSVGDALDGELIRTDLLSIRYPYQSNKSTRSAISTGGVGYSDMHLSHMPEFINQGGLRIDFALVERATITEDDIIPSAAVGASDCFLYQADQIILEVNEALPLELYGIHDIYRVGHEPVPLTGTAQCIGTAAIPCDSRKIAAIVMTNDPGDYPVFKEPDEVSAAIGAHIISFLRGEVATGRRSASLSPIQSGVGNVTDAVLADLRSSGFTGLRMYTEVIQDSALKLIWEGEMAGVSTTAASLSQKKLELFYENIGFFREQLVIRPRGITDNPELVRCLGLISMNAPVECDLYGSVNSTHIMRDRMMNGTGDSGDFTRNVGLTIFATASVTKEGAISCIVPMCSHIDHTEHDVQVIVTRQGLADLHWKSPRQRTESIMKRYAHLQHRPLLREYLEDAAKYEGHTPRNLQQALSWYTRYLDIGTMLPG